MEKTVVNLHEWIVEGIGCSLPVGIFWWHFEKWFQSDSSRNYVKKTLEKKNTKNNYNLFLENFLMSLSGKFSAIPLAIKFWKFFFL